eukprot:COSAG01_NODE_759_length_13802_cov_16.155221_16_plen_246_part_00
MRSGVISIYAVRSRGNQLGGLCHHLVAHLETLGFLSRRRINVRHADAAHESQVTTCTLLHASIRMPQAQGALHMPALRASSLHTLHCLSGSACCPMARLLSAASHCSPATPQHAATSSWAYVTIWLLTRKHLFPSRVDGSTSVTLTLRTSHRSQPVLCLHASMRLPQAQGALHVPTLRASGLHTLRGVSGSACCPMARLLSAVSYYCSLVTPWHAATSSGTYVTIWLLTRKHLFPSRVDGLRLSR